MSPWLIDGRLLSVSSPALSFVPTLGEGCSVFAFPFLPLLFFNPHLVIGLLVSEREEGKREPSM